MEKLASIDKGFTYNIAHDSHNKVTGIVWMTSYMRDDFKHFGNYLSIDVMRLYICNAKECCYITPVILNEIKCVITETHVTYTFILESLFHMLTSRNKKMLM